MVFVLGVVVVMNRVAKGVEGTWLNACLAWWWVTGRHGVHYCEAFRKNEQ